MVISKIISGIKAKKDRFVEWSYWGRPHRGDNSYSFYDIVCIAAILFPFIFFIIFLVLLLGMWL